MTKSEVRTVSTTAGQALRSVSNFWWLPLLCGVAALGLGIFFVVSPHETLSTFTAIAGIFVLVDGVMAIVGSIFSGGEGRGLLALIGVLSAIAGLILIKKPFETLVVFTLIVGMWFVVAGIVRVVTAHRHATSSIDDQYRGAPSTMRCGDRRARTWTSGWTGHTSQTIRRALPFAPPAAIGATSPRTRGASALP